jgi:hypothetical protein
LRDQADKCRRHARRIGDHYTKLELRKLAVDRVAKEGMMFTDYYADPYERADITSNTYFDWTIRRVYLLVPAQDLVAQFIETFKDFPPRQKPSSFIVDEVLAAMSRAHGR